LSKSTGTQPIKFKGKGKGLLTKKGVEAVMETVRILKKRRLKTNIKETGQSEEVADTVDSEETEDNELWIILIEYLLEIKQARKASKQDFILKQRPKGLGEGSSAEPEVPKGPSGSSRSSSSESGDEIEDKSSDEERSEADDTKKVDAEKVKADKAEEEKAGKEQHIDVLKDPAEIEVQSMVEVRVRQENPVDQRPLLVDTTKSKKPEAQVDSILKRLTRLEKKVEAMSKIDQHKQLTRILELMKSAQVDDVAELVLSKLAGRVPFEQRDEQPEHPRIIYPHVLAINYFHHFLDILENYNPMDDEPMWAIDRVVAPTRGSAITIPKTTNEFFIKDNHLTLVKRNQFDGRIKTDLHKHIHEFLGICIMFKYRDTKNEAVRLTMFPLSLTGKAKTWLNKLNEGTIETWGELPTNFISRFFPAALFYRLLGEIQAFSQHENETLTDAWLHMKEMLRNCHGHNLSTCNIIKIFFHGLSEITQEALNAAAGDWSKWFKQDVMVRPQTLDPEWHKEPNADDAPE
ncbi:reverse transcriptase domain-containing protein, partial [Tanacetum coccineum]